MHFKTSEKTPIRGNRPMNSSDQYKERKTELLCLRNNKSSHFDA